MPEEETIVTTLAAVESKRGSLMNLCIELEEVLNQDFTSFSAVKMQEVRKQIGVIYGQFSSVYHGLRRKMRDYVYSSNGGILDE